MKVELPKRQGLTAKTVREFLADPQWTKDEEQEITTLYNPDIVYRHSDGRVMMVFPAGRGCLYKTPQDFAQMVEASRQIKSEQSKGWQHILKGRIPYGEAFIQHVPELIDQLAILLKIPGDQLDNSMESLLKVEVKVKRLGRKKCVEAPIFPALVAYIGEVMRNKIPGGQWKMERSHQIAEIWEPWIVDPQGRYCNSWSALYDMLTEPSEAISIQGSTGVLINSRRIRPDPNSFTPPPVLVGIFTSKPKA
jgi:hypothetical protein